MKEIQNENPGLKSRAFIPGNQIPLEKLFMKGTLSLVSQ